MSDTTGFQTNPSLFLDGTEYANTVFKYIISAQSIISQTQIQKRDDPGAFIFDGTQMDITKCGISELNDFINDTYVRLCEIDSEFAQQYSMCLAAKMQEQRELLATDQNNIDAANKLVFYQRNYDETMYKMLSSYDESQLTDEMKQYLAYYTSMNQYYEKLDFQSIEQAKLGYDSEENKKAFEEMRDAYLNSIELRPDLTEVQKEELKKVAFENFDFQLYNMSLAVDIKNELDAANKELAKLEQGSKEYFNKTIEIYDRQIKYINDRTDLSDEQKKEMINNINKQKDASNAAITSIDQEAQEWADMNGWQKAWEHTKAFAGGYVEQCTNIFESGLDTIYVATGNTTLAGLDVSGTLSADLANDWNIHNVAATGPARTAGKIFTDVLFVTAVSCAMPSGAAGIIGTSAVFGVKGFGTAAEEVAAAGGTDAQIWGAGLINGVIEGGSAALLYGVGKNGKSVLKNMFDSSGKHSGRQLVAKVGIGVTKEFAKEGISMFNPADGEFDWEKFLQNARRAAVIEVAHFALTEYTKPFVNDLRLKFNGKKLRNASDDLAKAKTKLEAKIRHRDNVLKKAPEEIPIDKSNPMYDPDLVPPQVKAADARVTKWGNIVSDKTRILNDVTRRDPFEFFNSYSFRAIKKYETEAYKDIFNN